MRTIETKIYQFNELGEESKRKAIGNLSDINTDCSWWEYTYIDAKEIGLTIKGFNLDRNRYCKGEFDISANECAQNIINNHGEKIDTYLCALNFLEDWNPVFGDYMNKHSDGYESIDKANLMENLEENFLTELLECYASILENECEYLRSDESIIDTILANEYEFTEDGKLF